MTISLIQNETQFERPPQHAAPLSLSQILAAGLLASPDTGIALKQLLQPGMQPKLVDGTHEYPMTDGIPICYPANLLACLHDGELPLSYYADPLKQYVMLSQIKQRGEINAPVDSVFARKHQYRYQRICDNLSGLVLDIGSDKPSVSSQFYPPSCDYIGLDPYAGDGEFRVVGLGEVLPFIDACFDAVTFNTSLDHILDYHSAIEEAARVLKPGGSLIIAGYAWVSRATLLTDNVHFHHFREYELVGALADNFNVEHIDRYEDPKLSDHRYGLYILGKKRTSFGRA